MADTEPKVVEEVPAAVEEEAQDPKVGAVSNVERSTFSLFLYIPGY